MNTPYTADDVDDLYRSIGRCVWHLQHLDNVVFTFTTLIDLDEFKSRGEKVTEALARETRAKQRKLTLGPLIAEAKRKGSISPAMSERFDALLAERNWLIHRCVIDEYLALRGPTSRANFFRRLDAFEEMTIALRGQVATMLEDWYQRAGYDRALADAIAVRALHDAGDR